MSVPDALKVQGAITRATRGGVQRDAQWRHRGGHSSLQGEPNWDNVNKRGGGLALRRPRRVLIFKHSHVAVRIRKKRVRWENEQIQRNQIKLMPWERVQCRKKMVRGASVEIGAKALCPGATRGDKNRDVGLCDVGSSFCERKKRAHEALPNMWARATRPAFFFWVGYLTK